MATTWEYIVVVTNGIIILGTVVGGLLTILAICTRPALRKLVNAPLASLSCAGILFATFYTPFWIQQILNPHWEPPAALCWLIGYASPVLWGVSISHMLCIALQRYFMVCTNSTRLKSTRTLVIMLLLTWLVPIVSFLPLYVGEEVKVDPKLKRCAMGNSDKLWAKIPAAVLNFIVTYIAALAVYILIQNHVRKSKKRVQANNHNAPGPSNHLAVKYSRGEGGGAAPSTSTATARVTEPLRNLQGVEWVGDENSPSSEDGQKGNDLIEPGKPRGTMNLVAKASGTGEQAQGKKYLSSDEERKGNGRNEAGKPKGTMILVATSSGTAKQQQGKESLSSDRTESDKVKGIRLTVATVSDQAGKNNRQRHVVLPGNSSQNSTVSAAERQITKMMMTLFAVYTICCMPGTLMVIFSSKVPAEAFTVGQILAALNGALNPIVYGMMNKNIRRGYKHIWDRVLNFITSFCRPH
ncbi:ADRA2A [Branchiostoma lanceolatum]|uniref:ADRA2A protein n=1 Tax=Branchiostoma lanceolatum TaxID=7740 RepID=A0A8J9ZAD0_BRALA|nr:ADRA2A [Branchiostoma lanceolatum]